MPTFPRQSWDGIHALALCTILFSAPASAQEMTNPAGRSALAADSMHASSGRRIVWEMPAIHVRGARVSPLQEERRVGSYGQPVWTAHRRFTTTRIYVVPEGYVEFEHWVTPEFDRHGLAGTTFQYELSFGLPHRTQLDLYSVSEKKGLQGALEHAEEKLELRWAMTDWGALPANPTLYLEWIAVGSGPDHVEGKLLLGGEAGIGWHWGTNLVLEHETGGSMENSYELTAGASRVLRDGVASLGAEVKVALLDVAGSRGDFVRETTLGPSLQWNPAHRWHLDLVPLFGVTDAAPRAQVVTVIGYEF